MANILTEVILTAKEKLDEALNKANNVIPQLIDDIDKKLEETKKLVDGAGAASKEEVEEVKSSLEDVTKQKTTTTLGKEIITDNGWIAEGWTGSLEEGFTHVIGQTTPLEFLLTSNEGKTYLLEFDVESPTPAGNPNASTAFSVVIGNSVPIITYKGGGNFHYTFGLKALENGNLKFILTQPNNPKIEDGQFDGTIKNISLKEVIGKSQGMVFKDTTNNNALEIRPDYYQRKNVFVGLNSGEFNTTGEQNVSSGCSSLKNNISGYWNVAVGTDTLKNNINGSRNIAIGHLALEQNIGGDRNIAIGTFNLQRNKNGRGNVCLGYDTAWMMEEANYNVAIGAACLSSQKEGDYNVAIGYGTLGSGASESNVKDCIAIGNMALYNSVSNENCVAIGKQALYKSVIGRFNNAIGYNALGNCRSGESNNAFGYNTLSKLDTGRENVCIGHNSGNSIVTNNSNVIIGVNSGNSLTSNNNVLIGASSGNNITTGGGNICIGVGATVPNPQNYNQLSIGNTIYGDVYKKRIGIGVEVPSATLTLRASDGSPSSAPVKLLTGTLLTTPEPGAIEYSNNKLYFTLGNGIRKEIAFV